jgi:hypothetical protein
MDDDSVTFREARAYFGLDSIVVSDFNFVQTRFAFFDSECHPLVAMSEECTGWYFENVITVPVR